jgi:hypothetical protein
VQITSTRRPFNSSEREAVAASARGPNSLKDDVLAYAFAFVLLALGLNLAVHLLGLPKDLWSEIAIGGAALLAFVGPWYLRRDVARLSARFGKPDALRQDLEDGQAEEVSYEAVDAIQVEEDSDLGSNYYVRLNDGQVLFLCGQYLYELEDAQTFPSTQFTLVRTPHARMFLDLRVSGSYLRPSTTRPRFTDQEYRSGVVPHNGDLLDLNFETLRKGPPNTSLERSRAR